MKSIKKLKSTGKAVAGSALLVGATLTGAAGLAAAQDSGSTDLGDYPTPFVDEDGEVDTTIVVGDQAATADVVGAINVAGSLGNSAFMEEEVNVDVTGATASWSAENGATLERQNSPLFFNDATDGEETRLDETDINALEETSFQSEDTEEVNVEHEVRLGTQNQNFNAKVGDVDDPVLHVQNPTNPTKNDHLFSAEVEFSETMDFTVQDTDDKFGNADEVIEDGDEIELFGNEYTYSEDSDADELVLFGSSDRFEVNTGESTTVTVDGNEHEFAAEYVNDGGSPATITVDGSTESVEEGDEVQVSGQNVRVSDIYRTGADGQGRVAFSMGSEELALQNSGDVELNGDTVDGVELNVQGSNFSEADGMDFYFGAADSDEDYVGAGEMYEDPLFGLQFHYGGLSGDVVEEPAEAIDLEANEDGEATVTVNSPQGDSTEMTYADVDASGLAVDQGDQIATWEGQKVDEDDYVVLNSNEEAGLYELTGVTEDLANAGNGNGDVSVTLQNAVTGDSVTIDEDDIDTSDDEYDSSGSTDVYTLSGESIEGKDYDVTFYRDDNKVSFNRTSGTDVQLYPNLYTSSDAAVAFTEEVSWTSSEFNSTFSDKQEIRLPSTDSSSDVTVNVTDFGAVQGNGNGGAELAGEATSGDQTHFEGGQVDYVADTTHEMFVNVSLDSDQGSTDGGLASRASVAVIQPQDDDDEEHGYIFTPDVSDSAGDLDVNYTAGEKTSFEGDVGVDDWVKADLDSEDNVEVGYNDYGVYTSYDTDDSDQETFNLHLPGAQSTAGMAVTGADGELSASGGGSASATTQTATGWPESAALDTEVSGSDRNQDLILVGGPAVNTLTEELAQDNKTWTADQYDEDTWVLDLVEGFSEDSHALVVAGHSADDTRAASSYISNYADNADELAGETTVSMTTSASQ